MTPAGTGTREPLRDTVQHLWGRAVDAGGYRVTTNPSTDSQDWHGVRTFYVIGAPSRPSLLVQRDGRASLARSLMAYRQLRTLRPQLARAALGSAAGLGVPLSKNVLRLERHVAAADTSPEPLAAIEDALGERALTHVGIRRGANAKATAQLFSTTGEPLGYAKVAWNELTETYVRTEADRLSSLDGHAGELRTPRLRARGASFDMPFMVSEPLPRGVAQLQSAHDLTASHFHSLSPIVRVAAPGTTHHMRRLLDRLHEGRGDPVLARVIGHVSDLAQQLNASPVALPILAYDHGDLVPWNASRAPDGSIWVWDWESSEDDIAGGTDAVHWFVHANHGPAPKDLVAATADAAQRAKPVHRALGMGTRESALASAIYALHSAERACSLARAHNSWKKNRVDEDTVMDLSRLGRSLLAAV